MELIKLSLDKIKPYEKNPRKNDMAVEAVMKSIEQCSYVAPIIVDENYVILAGHTRYKALKRLNCAEVEVVVKAGLTDEQKRKYRLLDNKTNEFAEWDFDLLPDELDGLDFGDLDLNWGLPEDEAEKENVEDEAPEVDEENEPITKLGDIWQLGRHRLICGDSTDKATVERLMDGKKADMVLSDPPYGMCLVHLTQKPVTLLVDIINQWGNGCNIIVDSFGGSGSTLIACEQLNRVCYMCELDEK